MGLAQRDKIAAAVTATVQSLLPFLVVVHVLTWTSDTIAAAMLVVTNAVTLVGLFFTSNGKPTPTPPAPPTP